MRLTKVDLPTPEWPMRAETCPSISLRNCSTPSSTPVRSTSTPMASSSRSKSEGSARSVLVTHTTGVTPPTKAAIRARSTKPVRGGGSAAATTMSISCALATMMRSYGSVSSAVRRSTEVRSSRLTMRARVSFAPEVSPTTPTRSPTSMEVRLSSRARVHCRRVPASSSTTPQRPRSLATTRPNSASSCVGRFFERGREPLPGRTRTSDSS